MHTGDFSVERDRASCSTIIQAALVRYVANLKQMKSQAAYRLYFALSEEMRVSHSPPQKKTWPGRVFVRLRLLQTAVERPWPSGLRSPFRRCGLDSQPCHCQGFTSHPSTKYARGAVAVARLNHHCIGHGGSKATTSGCLETLLDLRADPLRSSLTVGAPLGL